MALYSRSHSVSSVESKLLKKSWDKIHTSISGSIIDLSIKATSAGLLTKEEQEKCTHSTFTPTEQSNIFMQSISRKVENDPSLLEIFIKEVLGKDKALSKLAHDLLAKLNNARQENETLVAAAQETGSSEPGQQADIPSGFSKSMPNKDFFEWLKKEGVSQSDQKILSDQQVSSSCFMDLEEDDLKGFKISFGGRKHILQLQNAVRGEQETSGGPSQSSGNILDIKHLMYLVNYTWDARIKWEHIGLMLGVDQPTLSSINTAKMANADNCYSEMLSVWLRKDGATWDKLLEVLGSPAVGFEQIARKVRKLPSDKLSKIGFC